MLLNTDKNSSFKREVRDKCRQTIMTANYASCLFALFVHPNSALMSGYLKYPALPRTIDWFYLALWITSIGYQALLLLCFFIYPDLIFTIKLHNEFEISFSKILNLLAGSYITAVGGYGIFNVIHRHNLRPKNDQRYRNIKVSDEKRKRRNGHRFIIYWWLNFLIMFLAIIFWDFKGGILNGREGPETTSLVIAIDCLVLAIGLRYAKERWK